MLVKTAKLGKLAVPYTSAKVDKATHLSKPTKSDNQIRSAKLNKASKLE